MTTITSRNKSKEHDIRFNYKLMTAGPARRNAIHLLGIIGYQKHIIRKADGCSREVFAKPETGH